MKKITQNKQYTISWKIKKETEKTKKSNKQFLKDVQEGPEKPLRAYQVIILKPRARYNIVTYIHSFIYIYINIPI